jgi:ADP-ribose pyrophosphatase YjhB (NUDIX family)
MSRDWNASVTVAAVIERGGRFLLVEEETADGLRLNQPAGHLEAGESLIRAVVRETLEETAHSFEPRALLGVYEPRPFVARSGRHHLYPLRLYRRYRHTRCRAPARYRHRPHRVDDRRGTARCPERHRSPLLMACVDDYLAGKRFALDMIHTHPSTVAASIAPGDTAAPTNRRRRQERHHERQARGGGHVRRRRFVGHRMAAQAAGLRSHRPVHEELGRR